MTDPPSPVDPPRRAPATPGRARKVLRFLALAAKKASSDAMALQSAALGFITLVSLIPLLAIVSQLGARFFISDERRLVDILGQFLPYSEEALLSQVKQFLEHAQTITSIGFLVFLLTALSAFTTVEETINRIWNVAQKRPLRNRLLSFTMVLFWGPLLIGASYSLLFYLRQQEAFRAIAFALPLHLIPSLFTLLGLTMLYWLVPYTTVHFRSALIGGVVATLLIETLRQGYGVYIDVARGISIVYGSFGFAFFFLVSIQLTWWIVLLGSEVAYAIQHFELLTQARLSAARFDGSWLGLAALATIAERFLDGRPITPHEGLAERLRLKAEDLHRVLGPLLESGLIHETGGDAEGYLLGSDPHKLEIDRIFELYEDAHRELLRPLPEELAKRLGDLRERLAAGRRAETGGVTLAALVQTVETGPDPEL